MTRALAMMNTTSQLNLTITRDHQVWQMIQELVDWDISVIQVARTPKAKQWSPSVTHTHRLCAWLLTDHSNQPQATITIEQE